MEKAINSIIVICTLYSICILNNFLLGSFFVAAMLIKEIIEYKTKKQSNIIFIIVWVLVLIFVLVLTYLESQN